MVGPCPGTDRLRGMLLEDLPPDECAPIEEHVAGCLDCQRVLADLTSDSRFDAAVAGDTVGPDVTDFLRKILGRRPGSTQAPGDSQRATLPSQPPEAPAARPSVDGYAILDELGRGGMGVVYRAREIRLNRIVALKMLLPGAHASPDLVARFKAEAETVARLQHPHVVQIHSVGEHEGQPFFVMEYVGGGSLAARLDGTPRPALEASRLVEAIARGVEAVHRLGVIHRDLKPGNVLMAADGTPKLGDFGLAKDLADDSGLTRTDTVLGSPSYMSPEQAEGGARRAGPASDVYSLGAIYYEALTGRPPFRGESILETLRQVRTADPVPPSRLVPGLSRDAETIALKCLEKSPGRRYASAGELADDLRRLVERRPVLARRIGPAGRLARWAHRSPWMAGLAAAVVLLLLAVTGVSVFAAVRVSAAAEKERQTLYFARMNLTQQAWEASDVVRMRELLQAHRHDPRRGFEWSYWWRLAHRSAGGLVGHGRRVAAVAFSPDGRRLVSAGDEPALIVWDPARFEARTEIPMTIRASSLAVAPDGSTIAVGGEDGAIRIWGAGDREPRVTLESRAGGAVMAMAFVDDGTLASCHVPNISRAWDRRSGRLLRERQGSDLPPPRVLLSQLPPHAITADGRLVAAASLDGTVFVRPAEVGGPVRVDPGRTSKDRGFSSTAGVRFDAEEAFPAGPLPVRSLAFSPDGRLLAVGGEDRLITVLDLGRRVTLHTFRGHTGSVWSLAFSPDGRSLAAAGLDNTVTIWDIASGHLTMSLKGHGGPVMAVTFSPDGRSVASGSEDRTVQLWRVGVGDSDAPLDGHAEGVQAVAFSPDGSTVATGGRDKRIVFWSATTGERSGVIEARSPDNPHGHPDVLGALVYSHDGRWLVSSGRRATIRIWDARTRALAAELGGGDPERHDVRTLAISPDDSLLASGREDGLVTLWDLARRTPVVAFRAAPLAVRSLSFSPDGRTLAVACRTGNVRIWDVAGSRIERTLEVGGSTIVAVAHSPDGRTLAGGTMEGMLIFWELPSWRIRGPLRAHTNEVNAVAFSPDGQTLISGARDDVIRLWDVATGELKSTLKGHTHNVLSLAVSPDGRSFVSGSLDRTARIWRAASEDEVRRKEGALGARGVGR